MNAQVLKSTLEVLKDKEDINKEEINSITPYMLEHVGNTDSILRDDLIYSLFAKWATEDYYDKDRLKEFLFSLFNDDKLFYKIGEQNTDSVFTRSFSCLLIPVFLYINNRDSYLSEDEVLTTYENIKKYFIQEKDLRGYVVEKGWAHSVAHTADAFLHLSEHTAINKEKQLEILYLIKDKIHENKTVFIQSEDERLVEVVFNMFSKQLLTDKEIVEWIENVRNYKKIDNYPEDGFIKLNVKTFLRTLYFKLINSEDYKEIIDYVNKKSL